MWNRFKSAVRAAALTLRVTMELNSPEWKPQDAANLARFLKSETGIKYGTTLRNLITRECFRTIHADSSRLQFEAGRVAGMQSLAQGIEALAKLSKEPEEQPDNGQGPPADNLGWMKYE